MAEQKSRLCFTETEEKKMQSWILVYGGNTVWDFQVMRFQQGFVGG